MASDVLKRLKPLLDAGMDLAQMTPARAEAIVKDLVKQGEVRRHEAAAVAQVLVDRGREATAKLADLVRIEVTKQLDVVIGQVEMLEARVADLSGKVKSSAAAVQGAADRLAGARKAPVATPVSAAPAPKAATKRAPAQKVAATKAPAKKAAAKKAAAKKAAAKKSPAKTSRG